MDPRLLGALVPLVDALEELGVTYQLGGSVASSFHGVPRSSLDIDVLTSLAPEQVDDLLTKLEEAYHIPKSRARARTPSENPRWKGASESTSRRPMLFMSRARRTSCFTSSYGIEMAAKSPIASGRTLSVCCASRENSSTWPLSKNGLPSCGFAICWTAQRMKPEGNVEKTSS